MQSNKPFLLIGLFVGLLSIFQVSTLDADTLNVPADHATIQAAIDAASAGDTVVVEAGVYIENLTLNKSLTLVGSHEGQDACERDDDESDEAVIAAISGTLLELQSGSADSVIDGFTFSGGTRGIESTSGPIDRVQILNNRIVGFTGSGLFLNDNGVDIVIDQNLVDAGSQTAGGGTVHFDQDSFDGLQFTRNCVLGAGVGTGLFSDGNRNIGLSTAGAPLLAENLFDGFPTGVNLGRKSFEDGVIFGNMFSNNLFDGLQGGPKNTLISDNTFDNNGRSGLALTGFGGGTDPARGAQNNDITCNLFTSNGFLTGGEAIFFTATQFAGTISSNVVHDNNIIGNNVGARYSGSETINVEDNWWGSAAGPSALSNPTGTGNAVVGSGIDFDPWLLEPADCGPIPTDSDGDGVDDEDDLCPLSDFRPFVDVGSGPTNIGNASIGVDEFGCTIQDYVNECAAAAKNHGQYVSCVTKLADDLYKDGAITKNQRQAMKTGAAQSSVGK